MFLKIKIINNMYYIHVFINKIHYIVKYSCIGMAPLLPPN